MLQFRIGGMPTDLNSFRRLFSHPADVVVSTCHGVKGWEYDTVSLRPAQRLRTPLVRHN